MRTSRDRATQQARRGAFQKGWWDGYADDVASTLVDRIWLESRVQHIQTFQTVVVPGVLQTRDYAQTIIRAADPDASDAEINRWVDLRMTRQQLLDRPEPFQLTAVLDEAVLRRQVGGVAVMRAQLDHLAVQGRRSNVSLLVIPAATGAHASPDGAFEIYDMPEPYPAFGLVQTPAGDLYIEASPAADLAARYDRLSTMAVHGSDALAFIADVAKGMR